MEAEKFERISFDRFSLPLAVIYPLGTAEDGCCCLRAHGGGGSGKKARQMERRIRHGACTGRVLSRCGGATACAHKRTGRGRPPAMLLRHARGSLTRHSESGGEDMRPNNAHYAGAPSCVPCRRMDTSSEADLFICARCQPVEVKECVSPEEHPQFFQALCCKRWHVFVGNEAPTFPSRGIFEMLPVTGFKHDSLPWAK